METYAISSNASRPVQKAGDSGTGNNSGIFGTEGSEFMQILLAQLRNQNPMQPMDDNQLIGQMAQLNSLQELQKISTTLDGLVEAITSRGDTENAKS
jgi:flagellar basal-body rod modification protein FlgD